jgi:hypothetical protein
MEYTCCNETTEGETMDAQAKIYDLLLQTRLELDAMRIIIRYEMSQTGVSEAAIAMHDKEFEGLIAELDKRIEAHPLYESQK